MPVPEMLPCPFCGSDPRHSTRKDESIWSHNIVDWHYIECMSCEFEMHQCEGYAEVLTRWNARTPFGQAERERIIALMVAWDGNERVHNSRGGFDADALREAFNPNA